MTIAHVYNLCIVCTKFYYIVYIELLSELPCVVISLTYYYEHDNKHYYQRRTHTSHVHVLIGKSDQEEWIKAGVAAFSSLMY